MPFFHLKFIFGYLQVEGRIVAVSHGNDRESHDECDVVDWQNLGHAADIEGPGVENRLLRFFAAV